MSQEGFGTISNVVETPQIYNENGIDDTNMSNNTSSADVIIGVRTGRVILYITLTVVVLAILIVGIYFIRKKVLN